MTEPPSSDMFVGPQTMPTDTSGWWETERARFIRSRLAELTDERALIVDVGCGRGTMLDSQTLGDRRCIGVDGHIWPEWSASVSQLFVCAEADALPFRDGAFELVGSFDVLEHLADDVAGLSEQRRIAAEEGHIVTAVPADPRLWSAHDEAVGHQRRYTRQQFAALASTCGVTTRRSTYFFSFLWLPARLLRSSERRQQEPGQSTGFLSRVLKKGIGVLCAVERLLISRTSIPFGTSLWIESRPTKR